MPGGVGHYEHLGKVGVRQFRASQMLKWWGVEGGEQGGGGGGGGAVNGACKHG